MIVLRISVRIIGKISEGFLGKIIADVLGKCTGKYSMHSEDDCLDQPSVPAQWSRVRFISGGVMLERNFVEILRKILREIIVGII